MHVHPDQQRVSQVRPTTPGRTITWAWGYDALTWLLTLGQEQRLRKTTLELAKLQTGEAVLDVGCGTGSLTLLAARRVGKAGQVFGIDASPEMIAVARRKATTTGDRIDYRVGLIEHLDFPDQTFDVVLSSLMFHHLPGDLKRQGLAEIFCVLKPGGRLLIVDVKRSTSLASHLGMALMLHGGLASGVHEIGRQMPEQGFSQVETGDLKFGPIGYVRGQRAV